MLAITLMTSTLPWIPFLPADMICGGSFCVCPKARRPLGAPASLLYNFGVAILRAQGDTKRALYYLITAGILNKVFL